MKKYINVYLIIVCFILISADLALAARQNLDEVMARKSRYSTATFTSGPQASPYYFWQPETLNYTDTNYGSEIWRMTFKPDSSDDYSNEYSTMAWSYDGSRLGFRSIATNIRNSNDPNKDGGTTPRWTMMSDGSKMRAGTGRDQGHDYLSWLHTENAYLFTPRGTSEFSGAATDSLYKVTLDENNGMTRTLLVSGIGGVGLKSPLIKDPITSDDKWMVLQDETTGLWPSPNPISSRKIHFINLASKTVDHSWGIARGIGPIADPYGLLSPDKEVSFRGSSSAFINNPNGSPTLYAHYDNYSPHLMFKISGSSTDGGPAYADWNGTSFGGIDEIKALDDNAGASVELPHNPYDNGYMGHPAFDRWGHFVLADNTQDCNQPVFGASPTRYIRWGNNGCPGLMVLDVTNNLANPPWVDANNSNYMIGTGSSNVYKASHSSWTGWTDQIVSMDGVTYDLFQNNYKKTNQTGKANYQASAYFVSSELSKYWGNYTSYPRPSQSPDGTKVAFSTILFASPYAGTSADDDKIGISYAVAYYPYPPEIKNATKSGANVSLTWDFNQGTISNPNYSTPRTYTKRGWPNETTNLPPSPREIKQFRVWVSPDSSTWSPAGTVIYNNRAGRWTETSWSYETVQAPNTTQYYAVTSLEHSGLESHTLSNTWKVVTDGAGNVTTQVQQSAYPADPGGKSDFYKTPPKAPIYASYTHKEAPAIASGQYTIHWNAPADKAMIRYYNIYAKDGAVPFTTDLPITDRQKYRIASIPASSDYAGSGAFKYIDWLGATDGSTQYIVSSVDYQGNETIYVAGHSPLDTLKRVPK